MVRFVAPDHKSRAEHKPSFLRSTALRQAPAAYKFS
jgi:hypothetical protein